MKKRLIMISALVLALLLALFALTACNNANSKVDKELIVNGDFSDFTSGKTFEGWSTSSSSVSFAMGTKSDAEGDQYLSIDNGSSKKFSYLRQTAPVKVDRNKIYKVSVDMLIKANINHPFGAYVGFVENLGDYKFVYRNTVTQIDGNDSFVTYTFYVRPKNTDTLTLALCIGTENEGSSGKVSFDNVSMKMVDDVPEGATVHNFRKARATLNNATASGICFIVLLTVLTVVLLVAFYLVVRRLYAKRDGFVDFDHAVEAYSSSKGGAKSSSGAKWYQNFVFIAAVLALGTFLIRLIMLLTTFGMGGSMSNVVHATTWLGKNGVLGFFENYNNQGALSPSTLAPGSLYILTIIGAMGVKLDGASISILIRFINVLADMAVVLMIYFYGRKYVGNRLSTVYASLYAALPIVFTMSGFNGTFDSLLIALLLGAVILMVEKHYLPTYLLMTLAAVLDIRALAIAPIVVAYFVYRYIKDNDDMRKFTANRAMIVFGLIGSFVLAYLLTLPVGIHQIAAGDAFFNFKKIVSQMTGVNYFVNDAFNLYGMVSMNGKIITQSGVSILNLVFLLVLEAYVISLYFKNRNKQELILLTSFTLAVVAVFTLKVDYTYLFLSLAFAVVYTMISGDRRMYAIMGGYATLGFLDVAQLINQSKILGGTSTAAIVSYDSVDPFYILFCVLTVLLTAYYVYVAYSITNNSKIVDIRAMQEPVFTSLKNSFKSLGAKFARKKSEE